MLCYPPNIEGRRIKEVRIHTRNNARYFEIEYIYEQPEIKADVDSDKFLGVDLGLDNLTSCVTSDGASFIIDGKQIKSYNRLSTKRTPDFRALRTNNTSKDLQRVNISIYGNVMPE